MPFSLGTWPIPKGRVKLPEPAASDYLLPQSAKGSLILIDDFETNTGWSVSTSGDAGSATIPYTGDAVSGSASARLYKIASSGSLYSGSVAISKTIDLTNIKLLTFFAKTNYVYVGTPTFEVLIDGTSVLTIDDTSNVWKQQVIDVSSYDGEHTIEFSLSYPQNTLDSPHIVEALIDLLEGGMTPAQNAIDGDTSTKWIAPTNSVGEWLEIDLGVPTIVGGARIYWGSNVPNAYRIQASLDEQNWNDVYKSTGEPTPNDWTEYSWPANYARYLRLSLDDQGDNPVEVVEFEYYSRIVERVAAEHGHGSGVEKWREGRHARRGFKQEKRLKEKISQKSKKNRLSKQDILELIEELKEYIDFKVPD